MGGASGVEPRGVEGERLRGKLGRRAEVEARTLVARGGCIGINQLSGDRGALRRQEDKGGFRGRAEVPFGNHHPPLHRHPLEGDGDRQLADGREVGTLIDRVGEGRQEAPTAGARGWR